MGYISTEGAFVTYLRIENDAEEKTLLAGLQALLDLRPNTIGLATSFESKLHNACNIAEIATSFESKLHNACNIAEKILKRHVACKHLNVTRQTSITTNEGAETKTYTFTCKCGHSWLEAR